MSYSEIEHRLAAGGVVILDGGTGTELERRGVPMAPGAWCGPATLDHAAELEAVHRDYLTAGADVITANTFASSRLMLREAGYADEFDEINRAAVRTALRARRAHGRDGVAVAGSLSHMIPVAAGTDAADVAKAPSAGEMADAFGELAEILRAEGCDLILLEMMYHPDRMAHAFRAASETGLPVWAGFSARRADDGRLLAFAYDREVAFADLLSVLDGFDVQAAGIMHTPANLIAEADAAIGRVFGGPRMAYPDSGYFKMPRWQFENIIPPAELRRFADGWIAGGVRIVGGCCGLSPEHIAALAPLKDAA